MKKWLFSFVAFPIWAACSPGSSTLPGGGRQLCSQEGACGTRALQKCITVDATGQCASAVYTTPSGDAFTCAGCDCTIALVDAQRACNATGLPHPGGGTNDDAGGRTGDDGGSQLDASQTPDGSSGGGALKILSLTSAGSSITDAKGADTVTVAAIVSDTAGLDAIAGGVLLDDAGTTYAAFAAGANKSTYTATLSWPQVNQIKPIDFDPPGLTRTFTAKFYDNVGNVATAALDLSFYCGQAHDGHACSGTCTDTSTDPNHCGACGNACSFAGSKEYQTQNGCYRGQCAQLGACAVYDTVNSCDLVCATQGKVCKDLCASGETVLTGGAHDWGSCNNIDLAISHGATPGGAACDQSFNNGPNAFACCCF